MAAPPSGNDRSGWGQGLDPLSVSPDEAARRAERIRREQALRARLAQQATGAPQGSWADPTLGWTAPPPPPVSRPQRRRRTGTRLLAMLAVAALIGAGLGWERWSPGRSLALDLGGGDVFGRRTSASTDRPPPPASPSPTPLATAPAPPPGTGGYEFIAIRPDVDAPVTYDPCRPIRYVINNADAPPDGDRMVAEALARVSDATGLVFQPVGPTDEAPSIDRESYQPGRYGEVWAPVVIGWTTPEAEPALAGEVAGQGGSAWLEIDNVLVDGQRVSRTAAFISGVIALDGPQIAQIAGQGPQGYAAARAVVMHEAGHLVGLQHVNDPSQLMNPSNSAGVTDFAVGDLRGLAQLGRGPCIPEL